MCGRFVQYSPLDLICEFFNIDVVTCDIKPSYNIAPTHEVLAVIRHNGNRLGKLHWGLVPSWAKDPSGASRLINARIETLKEKPSFCNAFKKRRCLIIADGFYEWKRDNHQKQPWYFTSPSGNPFAFAGLWETWKSKDGSNYSSCTIITTPSMESVMKIHNRMPFILSQDAIAPWLDPDIQDGKQIETILRDGQVRKLRGYPISKFVNSVANNEARCIEQLEFQ